MVSLFGDCQQISVSTVDWVVIGQRIGVRVFFFCGLSSNHSKRKLGHYAPGLDWTDMHRYCIMLEVDRSSLCNALRRSHLGFNFIVLSYIEMYVCYPVYLAYLCTV